MSETTEYRLVMPERGVREEIKKEHIPLELLPYRQWVCWRYVDRGPGKKPDKRPLNPQNLHNAGVHWPNTWGSFEQAWTAYAAHTADGIAGIGLVLTPIDPFVGVDLDYCISDEGLSPYAETVIDHLGSYTEVSPSGAGLRILVACPGFIRNARRAELEVYSHSRFLTVTGHHLDGTPAAVASVEPESIEALLLEPETTTVAAQQARTEPLPGPVDTSELWRRIFAHDRFGEQHRRRYAGDLSVDGGDHSLAVIRLLNCLARWTAGDDVQMRALMLLSPLANDKWFSKRGERDWLDHQIADAISYTRRRG